MGGGGNGVAAILNEYGTLLVTLGGVLTLVWIVARPHISKLVTTEVSSRFTKLEGKVETLERAVERLSSEGETMEGKLDELGEKVDNTLGTMMETLRRVEHTMGETATAVARIEGREEGRREAVRENEAKRRKTD